MDLETTVSKINIAIDGPAGAGKSTVARLVAKSLGYIYIDTGAMYRAVTLKAIRQGVDPKNAAALKALAESAEIRLVPGPDGQRVHLDGEDVTELIRTDEVTRLVPILSAVKEIREEMTKRQRDLAAQRGVVMDGRDIGTAVMPDAEVKIFLTASVRVRAERRWEELKRSPSDMTFEELVESIQERDRSDAEREISPLRKAEDAVVLDTSEISAEQAAEAIVSLCRKALGE
jgi:cytidylate kinase